MMRISLVRLVPFVFALASSASAVPVTYSFSLANSTTGAKELSFQYVSPSYIGPGGVFVNAQNLSNVFVSDDIGLASGPFTLFGVGLNQDTGTNGVPTYVHVAPTILEGGDFNQEIFVDLLVGPNVYLDRDGTFVAPATPNGYINGGTATLSVAAAPEPSAFSLILLAAPAAWLYRRRRAQP